MKNEVKDKLVSKEKVEDKKEEKKEKKTFRFCKDCLWYDKSSEREFHRRVGPINKEGRRSEIIEIRAICRNKNAKSHNRLVLGKYKKRQCPNWQKGKYNQRQ